MDAIRQLREGALITAHLPAVLAHAQSITNIFETAQNRCIQVMGNRRATSGRVTLNTWVIIAVISVR